MIKRCHHEQKLGRLFLEALDRNMAREVPLGTSFEDFVQDVVGCFTPPDTFYAHLRDQEILLPQGRTSFALAVVPPGFVPAGCITIYRTELTPAFAATVAELVPPECGAPPEFIFQVFLAPPSRSVYNRWRKEAADTETPSA